MSKINRILKKIMIIDVILIPICVVVLLFLSFRGRAYVTVNEKNEEYILHMLSSNGIELEENLKKIGYMQGLGDWYLFFEYTNGEKDQTLLDDSDGRELYTFLKEEGISDGYILAIILKYELLYLLIYVIYITCYSINKKTNEKINIKEKEITIKDRYLWLIILLIILLISLFEVISLKNNTKEYKIENTININNNNEVDLNSIAQNSTSEVTNETSKIINDVENEKYFVRDGNYYAVINGKETNIISKEEACDIADDEARKEKYQYQGWHSEFYSRGKNKNEEPAADLVFELDDINRVYYWEEQWQTNKYKGQVMWQIRLFDENDALASLYIYVDAINGDILGAGKSSD